MKGEVDPSALSPAERLVAATGMAMFVNGFIPWWYRIPTKRHTFLHSAGLTGLGLIAILAGFIASVMVLTRATRHASPRDYIYYGILGLMAVASLALQAKRTHAQWIGFWLAFAIAILLSVAGWRRYVERRSGWV